MHVKERLVLIYMEDKLLESRIIFINGEINHDSSYDIISKLLYLDSINNEDISLYINSPGGSVIDGLAIIDCMNIIKSDVATYCVGSSYSMGAIILSCGTKGKRYMLPNSEVMIHQPIGGAYGKADDVSISSDRLNVAKEKLINILVKNTNMKKQEINKYFRYDKFLNSNESLNNEIIDSIIKSS